MHGLLADLVLLVHLAFILFAIAGALCWLRLRFAPIVHLPVLAWGVGIAIVGGVCPLTPLENALRRAAGEPGYTGSCIDHYVAPIVYPAGLTPAIHAGLGVALLALNVGLYAWVFRRRQRGGAERKGGLD